MKNIIKKLIPKSFIDGYRAYKRNKKLDVYKGNAVVCSICNSKFSEFGTFGVIPRKNARCHKCGSLERQRLLYKYFNERTDLFNRNKKIRLLHFAPEKHFYDIFVKQDNIDYFPCDFSPEIFPYKGKVEIKRVDITDIPFEDNFFDVIICNHVLEHIPDDALAMSEVYRVMKKGAWAILQVPIDYNRENTYEDFSIVTPEEREIAFGQTDHVRLYGRDYVDRLKNSGLVVHEDDYVKSFSPEDLFRFGLMESELIYHCKKI